ncbi:estradiol 17-beta-dehydrogenase 2 [Phymastichus coffea]|uniref:estradiol 17-beta-dehydrogenase 2 n=1 Tax=Phymastichus coffea TaxID=108790 RepID=UPI00273CC1E7|nr:estradiol 17-beta-dehydrogenase 2 [Phymastichus coffea]
MSCGFIGSVQPSRRWQLETILAAASVAAIGPLVVSTACAYRLYGSWSAAGRRALAPEQVVAITGCDSGLGYSLALHCREQGATVVAGVLQRDGPAATCLGKRGVRVLALDVTEEASVRTFGNELTRMLDDEHLELRALVNNAGVMIFGEFEWQLTRQVRHQVEVNVVGTMRLTRELLPELRKHRGRIINVTSHCALASLPGLAVYGATKAALRAWTDSLRVELAKYGVGVVNFIPGSFPTESNIFSQQSRHFDEMRAGMSQEARRFYADYFDRYAGYLAALANDNGLRRLENAKLYEIFDDALLSQRPSALYKCEPWRYTIYHALFRVAPTPLRDWLVERFVRMPSWTSVRR